MNESILEDLLHEHKLRITKCRTDILSFFLKSDCALSAKNLEKELSQYDRVTIYRTLNSFIDKHILHPIPSDSGAALYGLSDTIRKSRASTPYQKDDSDLNGIHEEHIHFACHACGKTLCLHEQSIPKVKLPDGYQVNEVEMVIKGYCQSCSPS